jgi:hypothetical protein
MTPKSPSQIALGEFRVIAKHIGTRDMVQEFLALRVFPTLKEWDMPKLKGENKKGELVRLPYYYKFKKHFKVPCQEWLNTIEVMWNDILGNYSKKEDQLMIAAFGTRPKRRLNRVMDALNFEYPDYERMDQSAEGQKRKRVASVLNKEDAKLVKDDEEKLKKRGEAWAEDRCFEEKKGCGSEAEGNWYRRRNCCNTFCHQRGGNLKGNDWIFAYQAKSTGAASDEAFQKEKEPSLTKKVIGTKKRRIVTVTQVI